MAGFSGVGDGKLTPAVLVLFGDCRDYGWDIGYLERTEVVIFYEILRLIL